MEVGGIEPPSASDPLKPLRACLTLSFSPDGFFVSLATVQLFSVFLSLHR